MNGIAILGLNGSGKSTLNHLLAKRIGYCEMDVEDYYFPEQRDARHRALENEVVLNARNGEELPYSNSRTKEEVQTALIADMDKYPKFILSGVTMKWSKEILARIDIAFLIETPLEERLKRIQSREEKRFGERVLEGGDMFEQRKGFRKMVESRDTTFVEEGTKGLQCPIVVLDGMLPMEENLAKMMAYLA